ncbi:hypothetical protein [Micromonospora terminaliae]|uniref:rhamnogalacturonan lyase family protein n=1 Tax=Micromonospora terminaliae TaxID=1914461 RepID=UPI003B848C0E
MLGLGDTAGSPSWSRSRRVPAPACRPVVRGKALSCPAHLQHADADQPADAGARPAVPRGLAWQNTAYNQPPHPDFHLGDGMSASPAPNIYLR